MKKNKCNDCKYNSGLCKVCIKDKLFYLGVDLGKGDEETIVTGNGILEHMKNIKPLEGKINIKDLIKGITKDN